MSDSPYLRQVLSAVVLLLGPLLAPAPADAQDDPSPLARISVIPAVGVAREAGRPSFESPMVDAWTFGAQVEYATHGAWTPLIAAHRWNFDRVCEESPVCGETGWSVEAGATRLLVPTRIVRPYAGAVAGIHQVDKPIFFIQGRAGVDLLPPRSPVAFRVEARFHRPMAQRTELGQFFVLNTGIRFMLPGR